MTVGYVTGRMVFPEGADCDKCSRADYPYVSGFGAADAKIVLVGESPGKTEVRRGRPFVGPSGKLLDKALANAGIERDKCYITNTTCCTGPKAPSAKEVAACRPRLLNEIHEHRPKVVVVLGNAALRALLGRGNVSKERGTVVWSDEISAYVVPTYHPAAVLRSPGLLDTMLKDIKLAAEVLQADNVEVKLKPKVEVTYHVTTTPDILLDTIQRVDRAGDVLVVDVETSSDGKLLCIGMCWDNGRAAVVPADVARQCRKQLNDLFSRKCLVGHNIKYDIQVLWRNGFDAARTGKDTMLLKYVSDGGRGRYSLEELVKEYLNVPNHKDPMKKYKNKMEDAPLEDLWHYNAHDVGYTYALVSLLEDECGANQFKVLNTLLYPASDVLAKMESVGALVDSQYLYDLEHKMSEEIEQLKADMCSVAGCSFNPNSPKQVYNVMFNVLNLPIPVDLPLSTGKKVLNAISEYHEFPGLMLKYREKQKLLSTYVRALMKARDADDRVHTTFNLHRTVTGRLSSSTPVNLQNQPRGPVIRDAFIATGGYTMIEEDLSQAEIRGACYYAGDEKLLNALLSGDDLHTRTACLMFNKKPEDVSKDMRTAAKRLTFGLLYGMSSQTLAAELGISQQEAGELVMRFFDAYPRVGEWIHEVQDYVLAHGHYTTPFGRVLHFPPLTSINKSDIMRDAVNWPVQSLASDITLSALIRLGRKLWDSNTTRLLLTVHDSILLETTEDAMEVAAYVKNEMERKVLDGSVPFVADAKVGKKWGSLEEIEL